MSKKENRFSNPITKEELQDLYHKITWEGGITEYVIHYGGEIPEELKDLAKELDLAYVKFRSGLQKLYKKHDIGGY